MKNKLSTLLAVSLILLFAAALRIHTFYLPHNSGDQIFYLGLAMKLDNFGFNEYNLKGIDVVSDGNILAVVSSPDKQKGSLLKSLEKGQVFYYSKESVSNMPPAFSYLLMLSHRFFSPSKLFLSVDKNLGQLAIALRPKIFFSVQFYAVWMNFVFSLLFIAMTFFLGKLFFNERAGLWAAMLVSVSPVDILASQRLWADEMLSFFIVLSVLLFWLGIKRENYIYIGLGGISAGIASLTKQSGLFIVAIVVLSEIIRRYRQKKGGLLSLFFNRELFIFVLFWIFTGLFWYIKITLAYGAPWYMPQQAGIERVSPWFIMLNTLPRYRQLYCFVLLSPLLALFYYEALITFSKRIFIPERILCIIWFLVFILAFIIIGAKEERYFLPVYPALAIFAGNSLEDFRAKLNGLKKRARQLGDFVIIGLFSLSGLWSIDIALRCLFHNCALFQITFK